MFSYKEQVSVVQKIKLADGEHKTLTCPFCGGRNKFTLDRFDGVLVWNCFRASCNAKGSLRGKRDITALKNYVGGTPTQRSVKKLNQLPSMTVSVRKHAPSIDYLKSVNSWDAYESGLIKIRYLPTENRVLFYTNDGTGAVGRALDSRLPKWWKYGETSLGISVGSGEHAVLVEDVASACAVSRISGVVGFALLGTNITTGIKAQLVKYNKTTLVLDNDASSKAVYLCKKHGAVTNLRLTKEDLKCLSPQEIKKVID
jgi:hypothetical protein